MDTGHRDVAYKVTKINTLFLVIHHRRIYGGGSGSKPPPACLAPPPWPAGAGVAAVGLGRSGSGGLDRLADWKGRSSRGKAWAGWLAGGWEGAAAAGLYPAAAASLGAAATGLEPAGWPAGNKREREAVANLRIYMQMQQHSRWD